MDKKEFTELFPVFAKSKKDYSVCRFHCNACYGSRSMDVYVLHYNPSYSVLVEFYCRDCKSNFAALAVALELDKTMESPTHDKVFNHLTSLGYSVYNTRGIKGEFYTNNRLEDLLTAAKEVLEEKLSRDQT